MLSALANWAGDLLLYPIDVISTRLKANKYQSHNPFNYIRKSIQNEGLKLYRGVSLSIPCTFIPSVIYIAIYDTLMNKMSRIIDKYTDRKEVKLIFPFFISTFA
jgi:hypothetical protein